MLGNDWLKLTQDDLYDAFDEWIRKASEEDYWSESNPTGQRIHWQSLNAASKHPSKKTRLDTPGCYLFGWGASYDKVIPRYVGQTGANTLKGRLSSRYIPIKYSTLHPEDSKIKHCAIATWLTKNELANVDGGWKQLPDKFDSLILRHYKNFGPSKKRVRSKINNNQSTNEIVKYAKTHYNPPLAVRDGEDFAKFGIDEIWFAIFPVSDKATAKRLEDKLKPIVRRWNKKHGRPDILNRR